MSPLWRDRIVIGLAPDRVSALRLSAWRRRLVHNLDHSVESGNAAHWEGAIQTLQALLSTPAWQHGNVEVVLSNHWVHYAVVPGQKNMGANAHQALAGIIFEKTYGDLCRQWDIRVSPGKRAEPAVATGIPRQLLDDLRAACGRRLRAIRPALMPIFNRARRLIPSSASGRIAFLESGRLTLASIKNGQWQSVVSRAASIEDPDALSKLLQTEITLADHAIDGPLWLCNLGGEVRMPTTSVPIQTLEPAPVADLPRSRPTLAAWCLA